MAIQKEIWVRDIAENLFASSDFLARSLDDSEYMEGRTVHLPQSGSKPGSEKNRSSLPASAAKRTDTEVNYVVDEYTTDPAIITNTEEIEVSYMKRQSILRDHIETLRQDIGDEIAYAWATSEAAQIIRTDGADRAAYKSGQTGTRKALTKANFVEAMRLMSRMDIPLAGRVALLDADHFADVLNIDEFVHADKMGSTNLVDGAIGRLFGFDIMVRSSVVMYSNAATPVKKAVGSAVAGTDNAASLFWHQDFVRRAIGSESNSGIKVFEKNDDPQYYGDVLSAMVRAGGRHRYTNERGVVALVEAA